MSPAVIERLRKLWERRAEKARSAPASSVKALAAFGWWFGSGKFPQKWSMDQLAIVLKLAKKVDVDYLVLERLLVVSRNMPLQAIRCIRMMCEGAEKHWEIPSLLDEIKKIVSVVIQKRRGIARDEAIELAEYLTAKGFRYFDDLLDSVSDSSR